MKLYWYLDSRSVAIVQALPDTTFKLTMSSAPRVELSVLNWNSPAYLSCLAWLYLPHNPPLSYRFLPTKYVHSFSSISHSLPLRPHYPFQSLPNQIFQHPMAVLSRELLVLNAVGVTQVWRPAVVVVVRTAAGAPSTVTFLKPEASGGVGF